MFENKESNGNRPKILIVEDEKLVALDIKESLKRAGYIVSDLVSSGARAIESAEENHPDLILMDIRIKGNIDGIETAEKIRTNTDIPIIYLTAYADTNSIERAKTTAPYGYILKPFDEKRLQASIDMALYKHKTEKKLKENERWLAATLMNISEGLIVADSDRKVKIINPSAEKLTGWHSSEAIGRNLADVLKIVDEKGEIFHPANSYYHDKNSAKNISISNNHFLIKRNNIKIPVSASISQVKDDQDLVTGTLILFRDISEQRKTEREKENLFRKVSEAQNRLKILSRRLIEVQEVERSRISRELHDEIGQSLTAVKISLQTSKKSTDLKNVLSSFKENIELVENAINQVRNLSLDLRPSLLDDLGLIAGIRSYVNRQAQRARINVKLKADTLSKKLSPGIEITCFRIIQEAVNNILKHSKAKNIKVELWELANKLHLKIADDGYGFDIEAARNRAISGESIGILGMQERVELVGGSFEITSSVNKGTEIYVIFPIEISS